MQRIFILLTFTLALLAAGCAQTPVQPTPQPLQAVGKTGQFMVFATLARTGTCEMDVAADYTALIALRHRAARALEKRAITVDQALQVQALADAARADLDAACPDLKAQLDAARREKARDNLKRIATLLETKP